MPFRKTRKKDFKEMPEPEDWVAAAPEHESWQEEWQEDYDPVHAQPEKPDTPDNRDKDKNPPPPQLVRLGGIGPIHISHREDGWLFLSVVDSNQDLLVPTQLEWGALWVQELAKPDPDIVPDQKRLNQNDGRVYEMVGAWGQWVWVVAEGEQEPVNVHRSIVETWLIE